MTLSETKMGEFHLNSLKLSLNLILLLMTDRNCEERLVILSQKQPITASLSPTAQKENVTRLNKLFTKTNHSFQTLPAVT